MSTYIIGDVHGCYQELIMLLEKIQFKREHDKLIFVGDLINRGANSLAVLRFIRSLGHSAAVVLGNHDISLIAYMSGAYAGDSRHFAEIAKAPDSECLMDWLRYQPLLIQDNRLDMVIVHAGLPPQWSIEVACKQAKKAEKKLQSKKYRQFLKKAYQDGPNQWCKNLNKYDAFRYCLNGLTRLRYSDKNGTLNFREKSRLGEQREGLEAWFDLRRSAQNDGSVRIIFGHWAALGCYQSGNSICLDSGCVWGGKLTALKITIDNMAFFQVKAAKKNQKMI